MTTKHCGLVQLYAESLLAEFTEHCQAIGNDASAATYKDVCEFAGKDNTETRWAFGMLKAD